jgi:hypothetical protein
MNDIMRKCYLDLADNCVQFASDVRQQFLNSEFPSLRRKALKVFCQEMVRHDRHLAKAAMEDRP